jgi:3'(2'), 5'-bisphosphate nucleotidase
MFCFLSFGRLYGFVEEFSLDDIIALALSAGQAVMEVYGTEFKVDIKTDKSQLTEADRRSNNIISDGLKRLYPGIPVLSEEGGEIPYSIRKEWKTFWLVDPLDGTKEFIKRNGEFTVNIALIGGGRPVLGVVYAPARDLLYFAKEGDGAYKKVGMKKSRLHVKKINNEKLVVVASRSHMNDETKGFIDSLSRHYKSLELTSSGSSLKLCLVAEGAADIYPRLALTMEWDTAAAHAIVSEAGGHVVKFGTEEELAYNKETLLNPYFLVYGKLTSKHNL